MNGVLVLHPVKTGSHLSTNGKCLGVIFVLAAHVITVIGTVQFSSLLHKWLLKMGKIRFWANLA